MKISYNWLCEFLPEELHLEPAVIADYLTDSGLEVEAVEKVETVPGGLEGLVIGEVMTCEKHPDADKLKVTTVNTGSGTTLQIVCGASNVAAGQKVVVATVGTKLYPAGNEPFVIKKSKIRGCESEGMLCAEDEIGLGTDHSGIMVLDKSAKIGQPAREYFNISDDYLIEIGLTPNRADAMSHLGVARDLVAVYNVRENRNLSLKAAAQLPEVYGNSKKKAGPLEVLVEDTSRCPRYAGMYISGIAVKPSPEWLQARLRTIGLRTVNNVVDITNYICHGLGQPLHAFDASAISGSKVIVKTLPDGTTFTTLDGTERKVSDSDLMICHEDGGMCIAGVFGGELSGVKNTTTSIFLESAYFNPVSIRKTAKRHGLSTDASFRFERGIDPNMTLKALKAAADMIVQVAGGKAASDIVDIYPSPVKGFSIEFNLDRSNRLIGEDIPAAKIEKIFHALEIRKKAKNGSNYLLEVPPYRTDVQREIDITEEILRLCSFNSVGIPGKVSMSIAEQRNPEPEKIYNSIAAFLSSNGFSECMSNSLTRLQYAEWSNNKEVNPQQAVHILNPLSNELNCLRQNLFFSGLEAVVFNLNRRNENLKLYEFGRTYHKTSKGYEEKKKLALFVSGARLNESWRNPAAEADLFMIREMIASILSLLGQGEGQWATAESPWTEYGVEISSAAGRIGIAGKVKKEWLKRFDIRNDVFYAELDWDMMLQGSKNTRTQFRAIPRYPAVRRDLSLLVPEHITFSQIEGLARRQDKKLIREINLFDVYQGKNLEAGKKSYAVSFVMQHEEKTLTDQEVDKLMEKIRNTLESELGASLRS